METKKDAVREQPTIIIINDIHVALVHLLVKRAYKVRPSLHLIFLSQPQAFVTKGIHIDIYNGGYVLGRGAPQNCF